jgi:carbon-monoxide dehydrogenase medium subunit
MERKVRGLELLKPKTINEAVRLLNDLGYEAKVLGGGTAISLMYTQGLIAPHYLVSLDKIRDLDYIRYEQDSGLHIGALTTHRTVERSSIVHERFPIVAEVFHQVANVRVRNQATVGGVLAEADYASDPPCVLAALDAQVRVAGSTDERTIPVNGFIEGFYQTALAPDEIITEIIVPPLPANTTASYTKFVSRSSEDRPCVCVTAVVRLVNSVCEDLRVVVGAVAPTPQRLEDAENLARGEKLTDSLMREVARSYANGIDPLSDMRGSSWYRKQVIETLVRRTLEETRGEQ